MPLPEMVSGRAGGGIWFWVLAMDAAPSENRQAIAGVFTEVGVMVKEGEAVGVQVPVLEGV